MKGVGAGPGSCGEDSGGKETDLSFKGVPLPSAMTKSFPVNHLHSDKASLRGAGPQLCSVFEDDPQCAEGFPGSPAPGGVFELSGEAECQQWEPYWGAGWGEGEEGETDGSQSEVEQKQK